MKKALLIVDPQNGFFPGGALGVLLADLIIPFLNLLIAFAVLMGWTVIVSRDWHPKKTVHFKKYGGKWLQHCVRYTYSARFHPGLKLPKHYVLISKGMSDADDGYSPFEGYDRHKRSLNEVLESLGIRKLYVAGLATDYCVKACVLDAKKLGYDVSLVTDAIAAVNIHPNDGELALQEMHKAGAILTTTQEVLENER